MAIKLKGGGVSKALMAWPLVEEELYFFAASLRRFLLTTYRESINHFLFSYVLCQIA